MRLAPLSLLLIVALAGSAAVAQTPSTIEEKMTGAEFTAAGLHKLTPEELAALNAWLASSGSKLGVPGATPAVLDERGFEHRGPQGGPVYGTIVGNFRGWKGRGDRITLANGQVWEVVDGTTQLSVNVENPRVAIEPGMLGSWHLSIEGYNTRARVKRVK